jgi:ATP-dependent Clp protease ATP-binding subunit ClpA
VTFKPEFLNRLDETILFRRLGEEQILEIVDLELRQLELRLAERKIVLDTNTAAKELLAREGFDPAYGARPLKRTIQRLVQNPLAKKLLSGEFKEGDTIRISAGKEGLKFVKAGAASAV